MESEKKIKLVAAIATVLFFVALGFAGIFFQKNSGLKQKADQATLKSENLLAEKLKLDKEIIDFKASMASLNGKNNELNIFLIEMKNKLTEREASVDKLYRENASLKKFKKESEELRKLRDQMSAQVDELALKNKRLTSEIDGLNQTVAGLQSENQGLAQKLSQMQANTGVNYKVEVVKRNPDKMTVKAKRTHTVLVSFELPVASGKRDIKMDMQSPNGSAVAGELKIETSPASSGLTANTGNAAAPAREKIAIAFTPEEKMTMGSYTLFIFDGKNYITHLQFRLNK